MNITDRAALVLQQIDAALALAEKATPGPWDSKEYASHPASWIYDGKSRHVAVTQGTGFDKFQDADNARHIANSRTFSPNAARAVLSAIDALEHIAEWHADSGMKAKFRLQTISEQWESVQ